MAPKVDRAKTPTRSLGLSGMTEAMIVDMVRQGQIAAGQARPPKEGETSAYPEKDEIVVFCDLFIAGLHFPLDSVFVETLRLHNIFLHQLRPSSIVRLNLYFWLAKTCRFKPSAKDFAFVHRVHYQLKTITVTTADGTEGEAEA
ncbi:putative retrotransposon protein [Panicum miliaceum]|uniref:Retrotransposon protein n=1 Tax=Panicum miliaceum TaxID=4540 RepID=A0A3L6PAL1_PANMI|nr:putative retrotransposon protein [Panicum miliaceum]